MITKDSHHEVQCWRCHTTYVLPRALYVAAKASESIAFYCPYGHSAHYPAGETVEDQLRQERDRLKQQLAQRDDQIHGQYKTIEQLQKSERELKAQRALEKKQMIKFSTRVYNGVCPCCTRNFKNLGNHMRFKHPDFKAELAA